MVDDGADGNSGALASLFTVTTKKAAPQYDYTSVPSRFDLFLAVISSCPIDFPHQGDIGVERRG